MGEAFAKLNLDNTLPVLMGMAYLNSELVDIYDTTDMFNVLNHFTQTKYEYIEDGVDEEDEPLGTPVLVLLDTYYTAMDMGTSAKVWLVDLDTNIFYVYQLVKEPQFSTKTLITKLHTERLKGGK